MSASRPRDEALAWRESDCERGLDGFLERREQTDVPGLPGWSEIVQQVEAARGRD